MHWNWIWCHDLIRSSALIFGILLVGLPSVTPGARLCFSEFQVFYQFWKKLLLAFTAFTKFILFQLVMHFKNRELSTWFVVNKLSSKVKIYSIKKLFPLALCDLVQPWKLQPGSSRKDHWTDNDQRGYCWLLFMVLQRRSTCDARHLHVIRSTRVLSTPLWKKGDPARPRGQTPSALIHSEKLFNLLRALNTLGHMQRASQITYLHTHARTHSHRNRGHPEIAGLIVYFDCREVTWILMD